MKEFIDRITCPAFIAFSILVSWSIVWALLTGTDYSHWTLDIVQAILLAFYCFVLSFSDTKWVMQLIGFIRRDLTPVEIVDDGFTKYTLAKIDKDGNLCANLFYMTGISPYVLNSDGTASRFELRNVTHRWWLPLDKDRRVEHLLKCSMPEFSDDDE